MSSLNNIATSALKLVSEAYSEPCQTSKMERFAKIIIGFQSLTIFTKIVHPESP